jgi:hypothetical protein
MRRDYQFTLNENQNDNHSNYTVHLEGNIQSPTSI